MPTLWFGIVAVMVAIYVVLDGFDMGAGAIHLFAAKTDEERRKVIRAIGPVWDGNEVWLLAAGGALYFAFPQLYASAFSGFYLPLMMVLWLLMLRAIGIEFRAHLDAPVWKSLFDGVFAFSSILLAVFFGAALGNVIRGVPIGEDHYFFLPLWTNWRTGVNPGILDWYTVLIGVVALVTLSIHGAHWVALKTDGALQRRAHTIAARLWPVLVLMTIVSLIATLKIRPELLHNYQQWPVAYIIPVLVVLTLAAMAYYRSRGKDLASFYASSLYITVMLVGAVFALYPVVLPATIESRSLTVANSITSGYAMRVAFAWWSIGIIIAIIYFAFLYRMFRGKVSLEGTGEHGY